MNTKNLLAIVVASSLAFPVLAAEKQTVETLSQELEAGGAANLTIQFPVGNVVVTGTGGDKIKADVDIRCAEAMSSACRKVVEKAKIKVSRTGKGLVLKIEGWPKHDVNDIELAGRFEVPRSLNVLAELEVGDLTTQGIEGDLDIDVEVGSVKVNADEDSIGKAVLDAGVGKAVLRANGNEVQGDGLVGQDLKWTGKGKATIVIDVNVGDILVTLD